MIYNKLTIEVKMRIKLFHELIRIKDGENKLLQGVMIFDNVGYITFSSNKIPYYLFKLTFRIIEQYFEIEHIINYTEENQLHIDFYGIIKKEV